MLSDFFLFLLSTPGKPEKIVSKDENKSLVISLAIILPAIAILLVIVGAVLWKKKTKKNEKGTHYRAETAKYETKGFEARVFVNQSYSTEPLSDGS